MIFKSDQMYQAVSTALAVAPTDATVLITGESGTGKEVITNQIYQASKRFGKPFLKVNCAAIPESLLESELFGYEKGSSPEPASLAKPVFLSWPTAEH